MIQIRNSCFETNSSSTHALCLYKDNTKNKVDFDAKLVIKPYTDDDYSKFTEPHVFVTAEEKLRYFWTIYNNLYLDDRRTDYGSAAEFMKLVQEVFPNVYFATQFSTDDVYANFRWYLYLEDYDYVLSDCDDEYLVKKLRTVEDIKNFFIKGVIIFGDRDIVDYLGDSIVENKIDEYQKIASVSG